MKTKNLLRWARCACRPCTFKPPGDRIFLCYRQRDSKPQTAHLRTILAARFGDTKVFMDIKDIGPGEDYKDAARRALECCCAVLPVIGTSWVSPRLAQPNDPVREELELALELRDQNLLRVIPVLVNGASTPSASDLPRSIRRIHSIIAWKELRDPPHFDDDAKRLAAFLDAPKPRRFARWTELRDVGEVPGDKHRVRTPAWVLLVNALWRPFWSNTLLPLALVTVGLLTGKAWVLTIVAPVLYLGLVTNTLFDLQQARCVNRCLQKLASEEAAPSTVAPG